MKKYRLFLLALSMLAGVHIASAQSVSIMADSPDPTVAAGESSDVSLTLSVPQGSGPADVTGYDLYLAIAAADAGYFSITSAAATGPFDAFGPDDSGGDPLATPAATGFVRNGVDQGFSGATQTVPITDLALETLTLSVATNTPMGIYTFQTTTTPTSGVYYSDVSDSGGNVYEVTSPGMFSINVVPEPSTWSLLLVGVGGLGFGVWQRPGGRFTVRPRFPSWY